MSVFVGGVGELYQGDLDLGRHVVEQLAQERLGPGVVVEDLHYGAIAVAQRLAEVRPTALLLVGATDYRGEPGVLRRRRVHAARPAPAEFQPAMHDAGTGYVSIDLLLIVCAGLDALPRRTVVFEVQPAETGPSETLSPACAAALPAVIDHVRREVGRMPLLDLSDELALRSEDARLAPAPALDVLRELLGELAGLDEEGRWGRSFALRDRLRLAISAGDTGEGMDHADWALWWALIEELDRLQAAESDRFTDSVNS